MKKTMVWLLTLCSFLAAQSQNEINNIFILLRTGKPQQALSTLLQLEKRYPGNNQLAHAKGRILYASHQYAGAAAEFRRSLQLGQSPKWVRGWNYVYLGLCHERLGQTNQAKKYLKKALECKATANSVRMAARAWRRLTGQHEMGHPLIGKTAPAITLFDLDGNRRQLPPGKDKVIVMHVGATW